jgi:UDP-glucose 4-epimerase
MGKNYKVLVTGGCGYIGSHTSINLLESGYDVLSVDHLERSRSFVAGRITDITGHSFHNYAVDCRDANKLQQIFNEHPDIKGVIHFAAYKSVGESVENPLLYFDNNLNSLIQILKVAEANGVRDFVFSSSCSVYGNTSVLPVTENTPLAEPESPYGRTKLISEQIIQDYSRNSKMRFILLRYFNPVGSHSSGLLGEIPYSAPENLVPVITQTAIGKRPAVTVYGNDYPTRDGSCIRDYIHVMDIADAHTKALEFLNENKNTAAVEIFNLGSGNGVSVLELIQAFEQVNQVPLNTIIGGRRDGDVVAVYADNSKAKALLGWHPVYTTADMVRSAWAWELRMQEEGIQ